MEQESDRERRRAQQREADLRRVRVMELEAVRRGTKLGSRDRLKAAFHLTRAWNTANKEGLRKHDFQDAVFERLQRPHGKRQEFRLTNWTLRRGEDPTTQELTEKYVDRSTPQKALEPYLVGLAIAAEHCGADPDDWKLAMIRDLSLWSRQSKQFEDTPPDDRPAETLAILVNALCAELAQRNRLGDTFSAIHRMSCRWEMFSERLVTTTQKCMQSPESPISPAYEDCIYFEEMFPFPSIPLLRIPYAVGKADFVLAPEDDLRELDDKYLSSGDYFTVGVPFKVESPLDAGRHYNIPDDAPGLETAPGDFYWFREIRLCIVPDGHGGFASALETRPRLEVAFDEARAFSGRHHVLHGYEIDLERGLFYGRGHDDGHLFPNIQTRDGKNWRLKMGWHPDIGLQLSELTVRDPDTTRWFFDPDPVLHPGITSNEPWYLSYTPATSPYLRHWLTRDWRLSGVPEICPWEFQNVQTHQADVWSRDLPPIHELNFPDYSHATWIECCLHNGLIEEALQNAIDHLQEQAWRLESEWRAARDRHSNSLLRRWKTDLNDAKLDEKDTSH